MSLETDKEAGIVTITDDYSGDIDTWDFDPIEYGYGTEAEAESSGGGLFGLIFTIAQHIVKELTQELTGDTPPEQIDALADFEARGWVTANFGGGDVHFSEEVNKWKYYNTRVRSVFGMLGKAIGKSIGKAISGGGGGGGRGRGGKKKKGGLKIDRFN